MADKRLTPQNATITTASVQIKTLTVGGKQVTQAVFRQLREEHLVSKDGYLNGVPWGYVNYHPDKCADYRPHRHVVWQQGEDLLRSQVNNDPDFIDRDGSAIPFEPVEASFLLEGRIHQWLLGAPDVEKLPRGLRHRYGSPAQGHSYIQIEARRTSWTDNSIYVVGEPSDQAADAVQLRLRGYTPARPWKDDDSDFSRKYELEQSREHDTKVAAAIDALLEEMAAYGQSPERIEIEYGHVIAAEVARRQRHVDLLKSLADLPQLFIAV